MDLLILEAIEKEIAKVTQSFQAQTGGASLCQMQKDGRVTGGVKYDEGRLVAFITARRLLSDQIADQMNADRPGAAAIETIAAEQRTWLNRLAAQQAREHPAIAWIAYHQGGSDALAWVLESLRAATDSAAG